MELSNRYIIFILTAIGSISCIYFLCLLPALPIFVPVISSAGGLYFLYKWIVPNKSPDIYVQKKMTWVALFIFTMGLAILTKNALNAAEKHGGWDAWAIWNYHAHFLTSPQHWQQMFKSVENDHPDYPLLLPGINAFFLRLTTEKYHLLIPFVISIITTIAAPVLIFSEFVKKHLVVASLTLFLFAYNSFYVEIGMSQYADSLLGLFFLAAMICMDHALEHKKYIILSAMFLGCCIWTKNEGAILALIFFLFYADRFFASRYIKGTLIGLAIPLICFITFKLFVPVSNDLISGLGAGTWQMITDGSRYQIIYDHFIENLQAHFPYLKKAFYAYLILCVLRRKWPDKQMLVVLTCLAVYMSIYVVTRYTLEWHIITSQNRLMLQLMPAMVYALAIKFSKLRLSQPEQYSFKVV